jgi:hypothetical protein
MIYKFDNNISNKIYFYKNKFILNDYDFTCICLWPSGAEQKS